MFAGPWQKFILECKRRGSGTLKSLAGLPGLWDSAYQGSDKEVGKCIMRATAEAPSCWLHRPDK